MTPIPENDPKKLKERKSKWRKPQRYLPSSLNAKKISAISNFSRDVAGHWRSPLLATNAATDMMAGTNQGIITWLDGEATKPTEPRGEGMMLFAVHPFKREKKEKSAGRRVG